MEFHLHLAENETNKDINAMSIANALYKFVCEHNKSAKNQYDFDQLVCMRDIADIILVMSNSARRFCEMLDGKQNANT
jgi:hypothetical protein